MDINRFNLRVYGLLIHQQRVLVTHENRGGLLMTKFPGGGLEFGEGLKECVEREFSEELAISAKATDLFYINDFLQISKFKRSDQLLSFYYLIETSEIEKIDINKFDPQLALEEQIFEWLSIVNLDPEKFTFPIDRVVASKLLQNY